MGMGIGDGIVIADIETDITSVHWIMLRMLILQSVPITGGDGVDVATEVETDITSVHWIMLILQNVPIITGGRVTGGVTTTGEAADAMVTVDAALAIVVITSAL